MRKTLALILTVILALSACSSSKASGGTGQPTKGTQSSQPTQPTKAPNVTPTERPQPTEVTPQGGGILTLTVGGKVYTLDNGSCSAGIGGEYWFAGFGDYMNGGSVEDPGTTKDWFSLDIYTDGHVQQAGGIVQGVKIFMDSATTGSGDKDHGGAFTGTNSMGNDAVVSGVFTCK